MSHAGEVELREIAIVGLGLLGSSVARAARVYAPAVRLLAVDEDHAAAEAAYAAGIVDEVLGDVAAAAARADLTVLAVPVLTLPCMLAALQPIAAQLLARGAIVTDVGSTKASLVREATALFGAPPAWLVPGHPLAGSERSGWGAGSSELFAGRRVLLCPTASNAAALARVRTLWERLGALVATMDAELHDALLAQTSHLPHLLAYALVDALVDATPPATLFANVGGGFRDMTRLAASDARMWRDIAVDNRVALLAALDLFTTRLGDLRAEVAAGDGAALERRFARAKSARDRYLPPYEPEPKA